MVICKLGQDLDEGLTQLDQRTDGRFWTQGILGHSHGIYVRDDQGLIYNHINGFIVEDGEAPCIWKNKNSEFIWFCGAVNAGSEYLFWQSADGIQWTGHLEVADQNNADCNTTDEQESIEAPSKGCQATPTASGMAILYLIGLTLTGRRKSDRGALSPQ